MARRGKFSLALPHVGLDSPCLSYLLDAVKGIEEPTDSLALEKIALVRLWFYRPGRFAFTLPAMVMSEVARIPNAQRREFHEGFIRTHFLYYPVRNPAAVETRAVELAALHHGRADCRVLAEAEELRLDVLLTYDYDFLKRLGPASSTVSIQPPASYWASLNIPKGALPTTVPERKNPLSRHSWWRW